MVKKIILASTSPRRIELLAKTGIVFEVIPSNYEEDMSLPLSPTELVKHLSVGKAQAVADMYPEAVVIGADTFIALENKVLGKPHTQEKAKAMLRMLSGRQHLVITGYAIVEKHCGKVVSKAVESKVYFKSLTDAEIDEYVVTGEPLDKAGAYAIQGRGKVLVEKYEGDFDTIVGLPVRDIVLSLKEFGV